jgi:hypothetical protein
MPALFRVALLLVLTLSPGPSTAQTALLPGLRLAELDPLVTAAIGRQIWLNEAAGRHDWLVHWLPGEDHLSVGIGHFIWYPAGARGPFVESFPLLLASFEERGVPAPDWLRAGEPCPWPDRASFLAAGGDPRLAELRALLARTIDHQFAFMTRRLRRAVPDILETTPPEHRPALLRQIDRLVGVGPSPDPAGVYALVDYVNFKGEGTDPGERYHGRGWGLLQVLQAMPLYPGSGLEAFAAAATEVLRLRVERAPAQRAERRWLAGWLRRVATYPEFEVSGADDQAARGS